MAVPSAYDDSADPPVEHQPSASLPDGAQPSASLPDGAQASGSLPDDASLPPVEPPSAGFIVQLFVVPALIVAAVIAVYLLFGRLASSDVDWRELVVDLRSSNSHARWRGANGLAQLLEADSLRQRTTEPDPDNPVTPLSQDSELANELAATLVQELARPDDGEDHQRLVEYLIKSLGWMDQPDVVLPTLQDAAEGASDAFLRQQALIAIGMVAGRAHQRGTPLDRPELTEYLVELTGAETGVLRHLATYDLGFLAGDNAQQRLEGLLQDADAKTRVNAAIGLARNGSLESLPVFEAILEEAATQTFDPQQVTTDAEANVYFERTQLASNALTAADLLAKSLSSAQRERFLALIEPLTKATDVELQRKAVEAQHALQGSDDPSN